MNVRFFQRGLGAAVVFVLGCGGEGSSAPPPEYPGPAPTLETTSAARADKPMETAGADTNEPAARPMDQPKSETPPPASADKPPASDKPVEKPKASDVPGANLSVGQLEADGLVTKNIECKSEGSGGGLGLLGMVLVTAWMSPLKKALDACAPGGETETRVVWRGSGGKVTEIQAKGDAKMNACVEKALRPGKPVFEGHCAATVVHGKKK